MTREEQIADVKAKIRAREGKGGYAKNVEALKAKLAELEAS